MKLRTGFVSNSSSASFTIKKEDLTERQINEIINYNKLAVEFFKDNDGYFDRWSITDVSNAICGFTVIDNGDMGEYLEYIGVDYRKIIMEDI